MENKYGADARNRSLSPALSNTPRVSFVDAKDGTQESMDEPLITPPDIGSETCAMIGTLAEILDKMSVPKNAEVSGPLSLTQTEEAGPPRIDTSPFSQYSIHHDWSCNKGTPLPIIKTLAKGSAVQNIGSQPGKHRLDDHIFVRRPFSSPGTRSRGRTGCFTHPQQPVG